MHHIIDLNNVHIKDMIEGMDENTKFDPDLFRSLSLLLFLPLYKYFDNANSDLLFAWGVQKKSIKNCILLTITRPSLLYQFDAVIDITLQWNINGIFIKEITCRQRKYEEDT